MPVKSSLGASLKVLGLAPTRQRRDEERISAGKLSDPPDSLVTINPGHAEIDKDDAGLEFRDDFQRLGSASDNLHLHPKGGDQLASEFADKVFVVHDQHLRLGRAPLPCILRGFNIRRNAALRSMEAGR